MRTLKLGLALGGGGLKGAAHVGVMGVLDDAGIKPDVIAGTSIGSLYGGLYAVGRTAQEMDEGIRTWPWPELGSFFRHRLKLRHNNKLARKFYDALAGQNIEDLPIAYAATASDITARCQVTIDHGPIIDAIEASIALPLIARPVSHQGRHLLDGGFWDRAPVDSAVALGADVVVAVHLGRPWQLPARLHYSAGVLATQLERVPLGRTMSGVPFTIRAAATPLRQGRTAQIILRPRMPLIAGSSPFHMLGCLDAGKQAALQALPAIQALLAGESPVAVAEEYGAAPAALRFETA